MTPKARQEKKFLYRQGLANLRIEGMVLHLKQHKLAMQYQAGTITHSEFLDKALAYARTR